MVSVLFINAGSKYSFDMPRGCVRTSDSIASEYVADESDNVFIFHARTNSILRTVYVAICLLSGFRQNKNGKSQINIRNIDKMPATSR